jgi:hypothetical protein
MLTMILRKQIGITLGLIGTLVNIAHFVLIFFSEKPEKYHGHELVVLFGTVLALIGLVLMIDEKKDY